MRCPIGDDELDTQHGGAHDLSLGHRLVQSLLDGWHELGRDVVAHQLGLEARGGVGPAFLLGQRLNVTLNLSWVKKWKAEKWLRREFFVSEAACDWVWNAYSRRKRLGCIR